MVGRLLVGFVWLNLCLCHGWQTFSGVRVAQSLCFLCHGVFSFLCHGWQTFSGVRVAQSLVFRVMVGRLLGGFVWLNLQFSVSWVRVGWQTFSGVHVAQSLVFCVMVGRPLVGFVWLNLHGRQTFSGVRWLNLVVCVMVGKLLVGFVWLNLYVFCVMVGRLLVGFVWLWLNLQFSIFMFSVSWLVDFQWGPCGSIFSFPCHGWQTFSGVRWQTLGFMWLNLQFSVSWLVDFQWASCGSIFSCLCHGWQTFSGVRVAQSLCFLCHGWQIFSGVRVAQSLVFGVMVGRLLVGFVWLNLQFSVSWQVDFQWGSCGSIFSFLCHGLQTFSEVRVAQSLVVCVMIGRLLVGFVWLSLYFSVSWQVDFQWGSRGSIFSFLCHGWQTFRGVRVAQTLVFCVMVGRLLVGFVGLNLQFSVSWLVDFQWSSCGSIFMFSVSWLVDFQWGPCGSIFSFLCHGWQTFSGVRVAQSLCFPCHGWKTFSGVRVAQSLVFCVMVGRLLVGFVWLNLQFSVSWLVDFQWGSCGSIFSFLCHGRQTFSGVRVAQSLCFLCHDWQTFSGVRVAQSLVFCVMVGRLLVGFVWLNLQFSVSWLVDFQ